MSETKQIIVRCRGVILHEEKMLVVKHSPDFDFYAFAGGKLEHGEDVVECKQRVLFEELGVTPVIGRLLYIHTFINKDDIQSLEFIFEIKNGADYLNTGELTRSHAHEIAEIIWVDKNTDIKILPKEIFEDFKNGGILSDQTRFIKA